MTNKTLGYIGDIEKELGKLGSFNLDDEYDRAQVAMWIFKNFCVGDWRDNLSNISERTKVFDASATVVYANKEEAKNDK